MHSNMPNRSDKINPEMASEVKRAKLSLSMSVEPQLPVQRAEAASAAYPDANRNRHRSRSRSGRVQRVQPRAQ